MTKSLTKQAREVLALAKESGLTAFHVADLPLPPAEKEVQLTLEDLLASTSAEPSSESGQHAEQSPDAEKAKEPRQGSSPPVVPPRQTEK